MGPNGNPAISAALYKYLFPDDGTAAMLADPTQADLPYGPTPGLSPGMNPALLSAMNKQPAPAAIPAAPPNLASVASAPVMTPDDDLSPSDVDDQADLTSGIGAPVSSSPQQSADDFDAIYNPGFAGDGGNGETQNFDPSSIDVLSSDEPGIGGADTNGTSGDPDADLRARMSGLMKSVGGADTNGTSGDPDADLRARMASMIKGVANAQPSASDKGMALMMMAAGMSSGDPRTGLIGALGAGAKTAIPFYKSEEQQARQKAAQEADLGLKTESMVNAAGARRDRAKYQQGQLDVANRNAASGEARAKAIETWRDAQAGQGDSQLVGTRKGADGLSYPLYHDKKSGKDILGIVSVDTLKGAQGKPSVFQVKHDAWLAVHPDDEPGALDYAAGHKQMGAVDAVKAARAVAADAAKNANTGDEKDDYTNAYRKTMRGLGFDPDSEQIKKLDAPAPAVAPKSVAQPKAAPAPKGAAAPAGVPDGAVQSKNGKWYWKENGVLKSN